MAGARPRHAGQPDRKLCVARRHRLW
ncbi:hypothetical protein WDA55_21590 [Acinetobacter baumannii]|nr:putative cytoplasmic protein [Salmonella enterica subsp. enterica serovar Typhimurium str. LT2] [Salmonella enterica]NP_462366.4 putative cytoplasmic protein [Salmonella enterica subsp. enterica serovar Typhimurium str. LT2]AAL22325.2 putative cytoplasmic protein [Salmonella enterica subsp. enterica serovar Typhimurium str. LT2]WDW82465.1 hypothetical protein PQP90_01800 [Salmonella enterica subsp. enterica serovar Uganda]